MNVLSRSSMIEENYKDVSLADIEARQTTAQEDSFQWTTVSKQKVVGKLIQQKEFDTQVNTYMEENGISKKQAETQVVLDVYKKEGMYAEFEEGNARLDELTLQNGIKQEANDNFKATGVYAANSDKLYKAFMEEGAMDRQKVVIDGEEMSSRAYLKTQGVETKEQFDAFFQDPEKSKELRVQLNADMFLNSTSQNALGGKTNIGSAIKSDGRVARISATDLHQYQTLTQSLGKGDRQITDDFKITRGDNATRPIANFALGNLLDFAQGDDREKELTYNEVLALTKEVKFDSDVKIELREDADPEIREALEKRLGYVNKESSSNVLQKNLNKLVDVATLGGVLGGDSNFYDDSAIRSTLSYDSSEYQEEYTKAMKESTVSVSSPLKITVSGAVGQDEQRNVFRKEVQSAIADRLTEGGFEYDSKKPISIYRDPTSPDLFVFSQINIKETQDKNKEQMRRLRARSEARISKSQLQQLAPNLSSKFDLEQESRKISMAIDQKREFTQIAYNTQNNGEEFEKHALYFNNPQITNRAFAPKVKAMFNSNFSDVMENTQAKMTIEGALKNTDMFKTELKETREGAYYAKVYFNTNKNAKTEEQKEYELVYDTGNMQSSPNITNENVLKIMRTSPQVFVTYALENMAEDFRINNYEFEDGDIINTLYETLYSN